MTEVRRGRRAGQALRTVQAWAADKVGRVRARAADKSTHVLAAGGVRAAATALELATGPIGGTLVAASAEAAVLAIATHAVRRTLAGSATESDLRAVLPVVIAELTRAELCETHVADGWRVACGIGDAARGGQALVVGLRRATIAVAASRVAVAALRKAGFKKWLWVGSVATVARLPAEVRRACELVRRAEHEALALAGRVACE
ncbi:hypothetical protein [Nannocystis sp. SCPEA4]|uniref:hypothetical protein n=1 Tax=Nannocystis sp. SCPEA4 TaxID=2996787 RepID=UPI00227140B9|nr:hypothetical protein [Nannocystis sp. SCPEA4]MCY1058942.1 hypothetical protein [Nannocystis sp. SCPEA4]